MKYKHLLLPSLMMVSSVVSAANSTDDRINKLENEIKLLKSQNQTSQAQAIRFNGFFSVGATSANNNLGYVDSNNRYDFEELTKLGLQASFDIDNNTHVTSQLLAKAKGADNFEAKIEWAYVSHTFANDSTVRAGKLRIPLFMYSDFLDVGIAQPWVRPPEEVYGAPISAYLGIDYSNNLDLDDASLGIQLYAGQASFEAPQGDTDIPIVAGIVTTWGNDMLTLRGTYLQVESVNNTDNGGFFYGLGASYDNGQLVIIGEYTQVDSDDVNQTNQQSAYITLGYHIDAWLPYVTVARIESLKDAQRGVNSNNNFERDAYSVGSKYNLSSNMSIKTDITYATHFANSNGGFITSNAAQSYDNSLVYSVRFDSVF